MLIKNQRSYWAQCCKFIRPVKLWFIIQKKMPKMLVISWKNRVIAWFFSSTLW